MIITVFYLFLITVTIVLIWLFSLKKAPEQSPTLAPVEEPKPKPKLTENYLTLDKIIGQDLSITYIQKHAKYCKESKKAFPHLVLWGYGGLGKSTIAKALANDIGSNFTEIVPANLRTIKDFYSIFIRKRCMLCNTVQPFSNSKCFVCTQELVISFAPVVTCQPHDIIFLEECHGLKDEIEEALYSLMQDGYLMLRYQNSDHQVHFPNITFIGATTQIGNLNKPFRDRFDLQVRLVPYTTDEMTEILCQYATSLGLTFDREAIKSIAEVSFGVPRIGKMLVKDTRVINKHITKDSVDSVLKWKGYNSEGLNNTHIVILKFIKLKMDSRKNGGAGAASISASAGVTAEIYSEIYEPPLIYKDFIFLSGNGRRLTDKGVQYLESIT